ncbi:hypothetical protein G6F50_015820 [Rhizopus delemar]|uniref:Uncharacterized protein n=1 Tax=Rhizopus delemar TaxID=936053 RepID=A0A9P7C3F8_9FUNG|nr:hypothetical protein G6F50_015820 [Rhizopus delemar]
MNGPAPHRRPAERLGQHPAQQRAQRQPDRAGHAPDRQRAVAHRALRVQRVDQRQRGREQQCSTDALCRARDDQQRGIGRQCTQQRGQREQQHAQPVEAATADQIGGTPAQQQAAAEGHGVGTDHPLQLLRVDLQRAPHVMQGDEDDAPSAGI